MSAARTDRSDTDSATHGSTSWETIKYASARAMQLHRPILVTASQLSAQERLANMAPGGRLDHGPLPWNPCYQASPHSEHAGLDSDMPSGWLRHISAERGLSWGQLCDLLGPGRLSSSFGSATVSPSTLPHGDVYGGGEAEAVASGRNSLIAEGRDAAGLPALNESIFHPRSPEHSEVG